MSDRRDTAFPVLSTLIDILAIPWNFLSGYFLGLLAPVAAIAAVVPDFRFVAGRVPVPPHVSESEGGTRRLSLVLMPPEQAKEAYDVHKEKIGGDLVKMKNEIQAIIEEAQGKAEAAPEPEEKVYVA